MTKESVSFVLVLVVIGALYIRRRWGRSPHAYRAMIVLAIGYFVAGMLVGASLVWATYQKVGPVTSAVPAPAVVPSLKPEALAPSLAAIPLAAPPLSNYDPARAARPDPKLTPGDVFKDAGKDDVCTPGWSHEHRRVTESERERVYAEYPDSQRTCACVDGSPACCEVDHLIPLELGGSNDIKNLWPQPNLPKPGDKEKDRLENTLHELVCNGTISLADAQNCIASDWVKCWETYVVPRYGAEWAQQNRTGW
jgi:hypothetical protein